MAEATNAELLVMVQALQAQLAARVDNAPATKIISDHIAAEGSLVLNPDQTEKGLTLDVYALVPGYLRKARFKLGRVCRWRSSSRRS